MRCISLKCCWKSAGEGRVSCVEVKRPRTGPNESIESGARTSTRGIPGGARTAIGHAGQKPSHGSDPRRKERTGDIETPRQMQIAKREVAGSSSAETVVHSTLLKRQGAGTSERDSCERRGNEEKMKNGRDIHRVAVATSFRRSPKLGTESRILAPRMSLACNRSHLLRTTRIQPGKMRRKKNGIESALGHQ